MYAKSELIAACHRLTEDRLDRWIQSGLLVCVFSSEEEEVFTEMDRARAELICHLRDDLGIAPDALPLVLSLVDQVYSLRHEVRNLLTAIASQPADIRESMSLKIQTESDTE